MLLNAVMCVWNEKDIIESTVKHAFAQGCSNVFLVDNGSTDNTVELAVKAGAILADSFESKYFDELQKIAYLNTVVNNYNKHSDEEQIWWLYLDDDEFPNMNCNLRIIDFLNQLDHSVRAVQGYFYNHIPTHYPYYVSGYHPADFMQLAVKTDTQKIPLLRYDKGKEHLYSAGGAHTFDTCGEMIHVAKDVLQIHHFKYRKPEFTKNRLKEICKKNSDGSRRMDLDEYKAKQYSSDCDSAFLYHYRHCQLEYAENKYKVLLTDDITYNYKQIIRWYDLFHTNLYDTSGFDSLLNLAIHYYFLGEYDLALCRFCDSLEMTNNNTLQLLITIKIAQCLASTKKEESLSLLKPILKCNDILIRNYGIKQLQKISDETIFENSSEREVKFSIQSYFGIFEKKYFV